jgi:hypothetical protein
MQMVDVGPATAAGGDEKSCGDATGAPEGYWTAHTAEGGRHEP